MPSAAAPVRAARRRPFGVLVICGLLLFESVILALAVAALLLEQGGTELVPISVKIFGLDVALQTDAITATRLMTAALIALIAFTLLQVVLLLMLRRIGWVLTMLLVGSSLFLQLYSIWRGAPTNEISLLIDAVVALYLNQSDVRRAFGVGAGRIGAAVSRSVDAALGETT
jgi:hypothetical protein